MAEYLYNKGGFIYHLLTHYFLDIISPNLMRKSGVGFMYAFSSWSLDPPINQLLQMTLEWLDLS
jgi:hypothetical protein